jgi:6-phosphogluconolactonase
MSAAGAATYVYVSNADSREIFVMRMDMQNGDLLLLDRVTVAGTVMPMVVSPDKKHLYAALRSQPYAVASFAIDPATGKLTALKSGELADSMANLDIDRSGRYLLAASYGGNKVTVNPINADGTVGAPKQIMATQPNAHAIHTDPSNRYAFASNLGGDIVMQLRFDAANGTLIHNDPPDIATPAKAGPRHFVFHPNGKFVYLIDEFDAALHVYAFDGGNGTLRQLQRLSTLPPGFAGKPWGADLHFTADGRFIYGSDRGSNTLSAFQVDAATGYVSLIGHMPTEKEPRGFNIDPSGRYLLAVGQASDAMSTYAIDQQNGGLTKLKAYGMGKTPTGWRSSPCRSTGGARPAGVKSSLHPKTSISDSHDRNPRKERHRPDGAAAQERQRGGGACRCGRRHRHSQRGREKPEPRAARPQDRDPRDQEG